MELGFWSGSFMMALMLFIGHSEEQSVVFPVSNETGPSLPVFPGDPVLAYIGRKAPLTPKVDSLGRPICTKNPKDTFCENVEGYPVTMIRESVTYSSSEFAELFGTAMSVTHRQKSGEVDEESICPQASRLFYPKAAVNENDQWAFVVNDIDYVQAVMAEICQGDVDQPCRYLDGTLPAGLSSRCRQKYAYKKLLALHPDKKKAYTDSFRFPSCCVCYVKKPFLYRTRDLERFSNDKPLNLELPRGEAERKGFKSNRTGSVENGTLLYKLLPTIILT